MKKKSVKVKKQEEKKSRTVAKLRVALEAAQEALEAHGVTHLHADRSIAIEIDGKDYLLLMPSFTSSQLGDELLFNLADCHIYRQAK